MEATYSAWNAGANSGGKGINYQLKLMLKKDNISFDSVWIGQVGYALEVAKGKERSYKQPLLKNDTIFLRFTESFPEKNQKEGSASQKIVPPPVKYDGKALIRYYRGKKKSYYVVKEFEKRSAPLPK